MDRTTKEAAEDRRLHPAAARAARSAGREHPERPDPWRTCFERDRDRIIHCGAFRRLEYKTQVFINHVGDNHRTRLTHSLEVMQVSRSLAWALDLNECLVEAVALAHDVGHPPFGHTGEELLDRRMKDHGGFAHNRQALRVVERIERRNPEYPGLNLSAEVRQSLQKHEEARDAATGERLRVPLLEAQLVDLADSTAYHYHDVDDGVREGILDVRRLEADLELFARAAEAVRRRHPEFGAEDRLFGRRVANEMLGMTISDVIGESQRRLAAHAPDSPRAAQELSERCIAHSQEFRGMVATLHRYLFDNFYTLDEVKRHIHRATELMDHIFTRFLEAPGLIPARYRDAADSTHRAACDYLSSMTDRHVERQARELDLMPG